MPTDPLGGVSFKRVFLMVSVTFAAIGAAFMLYVGMAETGIAHEDLPTTSTITVDFELPAAPEPVVTEAPQVPVPQPVLFDIAQAPVLAPVVPQWPRALTYRDAKNNSRYYCEWLTAKNETTRFRAVRAIVTGYCPCSICCGEDGHGITRTGVHTDIEPYGVAGPESFLRKRVHIPGYMFESEPGKFWKTDDTGSALNEDWHDRRIYHFDVRFTSHDWAKRYWGRRLMTVYIAE